MTKQIEAMKLALEALEHAIPHKKRIGDDGYLEGAWQFHNKALAALREALAEQPAQQQETVVTARQLSLATRQWDHWKAYALELQERLVKYEGGAPMVLNNSTQPAQQQEPVATVTEVHMSRYTIEWTNGPLPEGTELYTSPPAQPARKPLTEDEIRDIHWSKPMDEYEFARAIEAKLRSKNEDRN